MLGKETLEDAAQVTLAGDGEAATVSRAPLVAGSRLGRYEVLTKLGSGGMGVVYAAFDPVLDRRVAIKVLIGGGAADSTLGRGRMLREAQAMARLSHPNVIAVHDVGTVDDRVYIAMELVEGPSLGQWLSERQRSFAEILELFLAAGRGLAAAHAAGLIHRDFKPDNVLVATGPRPLVMDFGLARRADELHSLSPPLLGGSGAQLLPGPSLTATGAVMGTPAYMAPEQLMGGTPDAKSDQFSFCVALWEALYGSRPFAGKSLAELATAVVDGVILRPGRSDIPQRIRRALERGLSSAAHDRFASMDALLVTIGRVPLWRRGLPWAAGAVVATSAAFAVGVRSGAVEQACDDGGAAIAAEFSAERRATVADALRAAELAYAGHVADTVVPLLDARAVAWQAARAELCKPTVASASQLDRRRRCLDQRLREFVALVDVLAEAQNDTVEHAMAMLDGLPTVERCADVAALDAQSEPPTDPHGRARADEVGRALARVDTLLGRGRFADARLEIDATAAAVEALGHAPSTAQFEWRRARVLSANSDRTGAATALERGLESAIAGRDQWALAEIAIELIDQLGTSGDQLQDVRRWGAVARGAMSTLANPLMLAIDLDYAESNAWRSGGEAQRALASADHGLEIAEANLDPQDPEIARLLSVRGIALQGLGRADEALPGVERALAIEREHFGEIHPRVASSLSDLESCSPSSAGSPRLWKPSRRRWRSTRPFTAPTTSPSLWR